MSNITTELQRMNQGWADRTQTDTLEANVIRIREKTDRYDIQLRNGTVVYDVQGTTGFGYGDSVTILMKGKNKPVIVGKGYRNLNTATVVWV